MANIREKIAEIHAVRAELRMLAPQVLSIPPRETRGLVWFLPLGKKREAPLSFQDLSGEIRNRIYELVVADEEAVEVRLTHDPDGRHRAATGSPSFASRTSMALAQTCKQIRHEFRPMSMKTTYPVVSFPAYARFLGDYLFTGIPFPVIRICLPEGNWPSEEIDLRPLIVARSQDTDDNPKNSVVQFDHQYLESLFVDWAVWKKVLLSGQVRAISFRAEVACAFVIFTISKELGEEWQYYGYPAAVHECPEMDILSTDHDNVYCSLFKSEAWGEDVSARAPMPVWKKILMQGGYWDDGEHYGTS